MDRRIDESFKKLDNLDQYGSRGVEGLRAEVRSLRQDWIDHERQHERTATNLKWAIGLTIGSVIAMVGPLYPLLLGHH